MAGGRVMVWRGKLSVEATSNVVVVVGLAVVDGADAVVEEVVVGGSVVDVDVVDVDLVVVVRLGAVEPSVELVGLSPVGSVVGAAVAGAAVVGAAVVGAAVVGAAVVGVMGRVVVDVGWPCAGRSAGMMRAMAVTELALVVSPPCTACR